LQPEKKVVPQITVPLGRGAPPPTLPKLGPRAPAGVERAAPAGDVDDQAARCKAESNETLRSQCLLKLRSGAAPG
jgi:hypothetical protein